MEPFLQTERLMLRRFTVDDVDLLVELDGDPEVMRFVTGGLPTSREEMKNDFLPAWLDYYERYAGYGYFAIIEKATGDFLGWLQFRPPDEGTPAVVELGYRLKRSAWGRGYATEGARALIDKGFIELGVQRVIANAMAVHTASRRVMEKAGLKFARTFYGEWPWRIEGDEHGDVEYTLERDEWERERAMKS